MLVLLVGTGVYLTIRLRALQIRGLWYSLWLALVKRKEDSPAAGDISHFQALMTALAATVGTGNIAGVATAIAAGGPGALFWMWITGLFGMATKYSEAVLAVKYRQQDRFGTMSGGPMYYISRGLGLPWLGTLFALFAAVSAFGIGNIVQSNSVADSVSFLTGGLDRWITGLLMAIATGLVLLGGIRSIARTASLLVPLMIVLYVGSALVVLAIKVTFVPEALRLVFQGAFTGTAAIGGFAGAAVRDAIRWGVARGVFSNESGLGSSPIAAAAAQTRNPVNQALVSMTQTFIDTIVVCSLTGLVIITTGMWSSGYNGAELTARAFNAALGGSWGSVVVAVGLALFAYSTILGWSYYGEKSVEYLLGEAAVRPYRIAFTVFVFIGAVIRKLELVWNFADVMNGLMALPNLIGLLGLAGVVVAETSRYYPGPGVPKLGITAEEIPELSQRRP
ncbi:MAG: sodium:alanine symporter family protein [candidate division KSB1 bacterium]|nr:sodium:alanine symporter family protein [candidate division KSB1 bacterium]